MSIAPVNCDELALAELKSCLEFDMMMINTEREHLTLKGGYLYEDYAKMMEKQAVAAGKEVDPDIGTVDELNWERFQAEFQLAENRLQSQDKRLEMEEKRKQTKLTMVTNLIESVQKRKDKNIESEMKGIGS